MKLASLSVRLLHQLLYLPHECLIVLLELRQIQLQMAVFFGQAVVLSFQDRVLGDGDEVERVAGDLGDVGMAEFSDVRVLDTLTVGGASLVRDLRVSYRR